MRRNLMGRGGKPVEPGTLGVFIYSSDRLLYKAEDWTPSKGATGIAIVTKEHQFIMALESVKTSWGIDDTKFLDIPYTTSVNSSDFNGAVYTKRILNGSREPLSISVSAANFCNTYDEWPRVGNWYLPTMGELQLIYDNKTIINESLLKIGKNILNSTSYWSSQSYNEYYSWLLDMTDGTAVVNQGHEQFYTLPCTPLLKYKNAIYATNSAVGDFVYDDWTICKANLTPEADKVIGVCYRVSLIYGSIADRKWMISKKNLTCPLGSTQKSMCWGEFETDIPTMTNHGSWSNTVFDGLSDSKKIIAFRGEKDYESWNPIWDAQPNYPAASVCDMYYTNPDKDDRKTWWLPSMGDLYLWYNNKSTLNTSFGKCGGEVFSGNYHWTSSEYNSIYAWLLNMTNSAEDVDNKDNSHYVRACAAY